MARGNSFQWSSDDMVTRLNAFDRKVHAAVVMVCDYQARRSESFMRQNARWTDRTSNARNGLHANTQHEDKKHTIILAHSMPYGIWLEVRWSGKYGIIPEAVRSGGDQLMAMMAGLFSRI